MPFCHLALDPTGIEPAFPPNQGDILPLNYGYSHYQRRELNPYLQILSLPCSPSFLLR